MCSKAVVLSANDTHNVMRDQCHFSLLETLFLSEKKSQALAVLDDIL